MRVEQAFGNGDDGNLWLQYTAHIDGQELCVRQTVDARLSGQLSSRHVLQEMRRQVMREIEAKLFRGVL